MHHIDELHLENPFKGRGCCGTYCEARAIQPFAST